MFLLKLALWKIADFCARHEDCEECPFRDPSRETEDAYFCTITNSGMPPALWNVDNLFPDADAPGNLKGGKLDNESEESDE